MESVDNPVDVLLPIDGLPPGAPRRRVAPGREVSRRPIYRRLRYAVHRCDDCMANYLTEPRSPLALLGRYERRIIGEGARLLCHEHVQHWRDRDAMPPLEVT